MVPLTVVIPAYNEHDRLGPSLVRIASYVEDRPHWRPAELIVVDDGSGDGTFEVASSHPVSEDVAVIKVLRHSTNLGKGAAVRTGFSQSTGEQILLSDADLATPIEELETLAAGGSQASVRVGSRALNRELIFVPQPRYRDLMGRTFNLVVQTLLLPGIHDTQCGFKLFPGDLGRHLAAVQRLDGFAFDVELLMVSRAWGVPIVEVPVRWRHVEASRVRPVAHSAEMLADLVGLGWRRLRGALAAPVVRR